jgi:hypothetical protein
VWRYGSRYSTSTGSIEYITPCSEQKEKFFIFNNQNELLIVSNGQKYKYKYKIQIESDFTLYPLDKEIVLAVYEYDTNRPISFTRLLMCNNFFEEYITYKYDYGYDHLFERKK